MGIFDDLNSEQKAEVKQTECPVLVLAHPSLNLRRASE